MSVLRAVDFSTGTPGIEIMERTRIELDELLGIINGLMDVGFIESNPYHEHLSEALLPKVILEVNPGYIHELKAVLYNRF